VAVEIEAARGCRCAVCRCLYQRRAPSPLALLQTPPRALGQLDQLPCAPYVPALAWHSPKDACPRAQGACSCSSGHCSGAGEQWTVTAQDWEAEEMLLWL